MFSYILLRYYMYLDEDNETKIVNITFFKQFQNQSELFLTKMTIIMQPNGWNIYQSAFMSH